jgi:hypothetical protein
MRTSLRDYVSAMMGRQDLQLSGANTFYHFGDHSASFEPLLSQYVIPRVWNAQHHGQPSLSWGLAGDGTGVPFHGLFLLPYILPPWFSLDLFCWLEVFWFCQVPFHVHGQVFAEVLHGRKHWFLLPPNARPEFDPDEPPLKWALRRLRERVKMPSIVEKELLECTLMEGEILYLPSMWWHSTLNLGQTVFISAFV